jgi:hypothetical protein
MAATPASAWLSFAAAVTDANVQASISAFKGSPPHPSPNLYISPHSHVDWASLSEIDRSLVTGPSPDESLRSHVAVRARLLV